jgi:hypothetical protein
MQKLLERYFIWRCGPDRTKMVHCCSQSGELEFLASLPALLRFRRFGSEPASPSPTQMTPTGPKLVGSAEQTDLKTKEQTRSPEPPEQKVGGSNPLGRTRPNPFRDLPSFSKNRCWRLSFCLWRQPAWRKAGKCRRSFTFTCLRQWSPSHFCGI